MGFDIRLPIGYLFSILGALLMLYGLITMNSEMYQHSLGINVNLSWGVVLLIFGLLMTFLAKRSQGREVRRGTAPQSSTVRRSLH
jgi:hypothetical protein